MFTFLFGMHRSCGLDVDTETFTRTHVPDDPNMSIWDHFGAIWARQLAGQLAGWLAGCLIHWLDNWLAL